MLLGLVWYMWLRLLRDPFMPPGTSLLCSSREILLKTKQARKTGAPKLVFAALVTMGLTSFAFSSALIGTPEPEPYLVFAENLLGLLAVMLSSCWFGDTVLFVAILGSYCCRKGRGSPFPPKKQWARWRGWGTWALCLGFGIHAMHGGYREPSVNEIQVTVARLPPCLDKFRLVVASDVHVGPLVGKSLVEQLVAQVRGSTLGESTVEEMTVEELTVGGSTVGESAGESAGETRW